MTTAKVPHVLTAVLAVQVALAKFGIDKASKNASQGFKFRGIDDVMWEFSKILSEQSLIIASHVLAYRTESKLNDKQKFSGFAYVHMQYVITSAIDGSTHVFEAVGEGIDTADKASGKASSYAFKEALLKGFCVPVEGSLDPDFESPETSAPAREPAPRKEVPAGTSKVTPIKPKKETETIRELDPEPNEPELPEDEQQEGQDGPDGDPTTLIEDALKRLISKENNRQRVREKLFQAHGILDFSQLDPDLVDEVIGQAEDFVAAQAKRNK